MLAVSMVAVIASGGPKLIVGNCTITTAKGSDGEDLLELEPSCAFNTRIKGVDTTLASMGADMNILKQQVAALMANSYLLNDDFDGSSVSATG